MPYGMIIEQPGTTIEEYRRVLDVLGGEAPAGRLVHAVGATADGLRFMDVWRTRDDARRFQTERLFPAFAKVFGGQRDPARVIDFDVSELHIDSD